MNYVSRSMVVVVRLWVLLFGVSCHVACGNTTRLPNVIVILVDDMGFSDIGCYGGEIATPHIDRLAAHGVRFTQFYNAGRCCPTRASLLTGLHPHQVGIGHMTESPERPLGFDGAYQGYLTDRCETIPELLRKVDYQTYMVGKWHLGLHRRECWPRQRGFDHFYGGLSGAFNYLLPGGNRGLMRDNEPFESNEPRYITDDFTVQACRYVRDACQDRSNPFFLYLAYNAPHWPVTPKIEDFERYRGKYREGWEPLMRRRNRRQREIGLFRDDVVPAPHLGPDWESLSEQKRDDLDAIMAAYAACIDSIDQNVGRLCAVLEEQGILDDTCIFFLSDNGACQEGGLLGHGDEAMIRNPPLRTTDGVRVGKAWANASNTPFRLYKHFVHEGGSCTPCVVHWPNGISGASRGSFFRQPAYLPDIMATCAALSGATYRNDLPICVGKSLTPVFAGKQDPIHAEPLYWEHEGNAALRWGNWKLVRQYRKPWELYDLGQDRTELVDLAADEPERLSELVALWESWATQHRIAYPERFNMYDYLKKLREREAEQSKKLQPESAGTDKAGHNTTHP